MRPWSFSRYDTWEECPRQYAFKYVEYIPSSRGEPLAASRGKLIHDKAEKYLSGSLPMYPAELQKVAGHAMLLKRLQSTPEMKYAITEHWEVTTWDNENVFIRGILDVTHRVEEDGKVIVGIEDWKTGQEYPSHVKQMEFYVGSALPHFPDADEVRSRLIYIDQGVVKPQRIYSKAAATGLRIMLQEKIAAAEKDTEFLVKPGQHCRFCDYSKRYGGPCKH